MPSRPRRAPSRAGVIGCPGRCPGNSQLLSGAARPACRRGPHSTPDVIAAEDNAVVVALGTVRDDKLARLRAGEATSLVLPTATALGLASCPFTERLEVPETRAAVRTDVFGADGYP